MQMFHCSYSMSIFNVMIKLDYVVFVVIICLFFA